MKDDEGIYIYIDCGISYKMVWWKPISYNFRFSYWIYRVCNYKLYVYRFNDNIYRIPDVDYCSVGVG